MDINRQSAIGNNLVLGYISKHYLFVPVQRWT